MYIKYLLILYVLIISCKKDLNTSESVFSKRVDSLINNSNVISELTTSYHFKYYENGIGKDLSKPIKSDTIFILKNELSKDLKFELIYHGKVKLIDSLELCNEVFFFDKERKVLKHVIELLKTPNENIKEVISVSWGAQYLNNNKQCIVLEKNSLGYIK